MGSGPGAQKPDKGGHPGRRIGRTDWSARHGIPIGSSVTVPESRTSGWFSSKTTVNPAHDIVVDKVTASDVKGRTAEGKKSYVAVDRLKGKS